MFLGVKFVNFDFFPVDCLIQPKENPKYTFLDSRMPTFLNALGPKRKTRAFLYLYVGGFPCSIATIKDHL